MKIGVLGGGQLGRMMFQESIGLDLDIHFMDESLDFPVSKIAHNFVQGDFTDYDDVMRFGEDKDVITIEIEKVNLQALYDLQSKGKKIHPRPEALAIIQDKGQQKVFYEERDLPTSEFILCDTRESILQALQDESIALPFVQKYRRDGYDGKGVQIVKSDSDLDKIADVPSVIEPLVDIEKELAVIAVRNEAGEITTYPCVEMVFDEEANLVKYLFSPAEIDQSVAQTCDLIAEELIEEFDICGLLAVEYFLTKDGDVYINEVAPRPHNSGHHTLDAMVCSQFENHLRGICNYFLGSTQQYTYAAMLNILGEEGNSGPTIYEGMNQVLELENTHIHMYGKSICKPKRKMGHINVLGNSREEIEHKIDIIQEHFKVKA